MKPVVVVGSMNMDMVSKTRRFPRAGETITGASFYTSFGGKGANQAVTVARLGLPVVFIGCVGDDGFGRDILAHMREEGIDTSHIRTVSGCSTGTAMIIVDAKGQNRIVVAPGANHEVSAEQVGEAEGEIFNATAVVAQFEIPFESVLAAARLAANHRVPFILNPAPALPRAQHAAPLLDTSLLKIEILVPNEIEAEALTGVKQNSPDFPAAAIRNLKKQGAKTVIITLGEKGCMLGADRKAQRIPPYKVHVEDTTAAGDAFVGALAAGYRFYPDTRALARFASAIAALAVTKKGAQSSLPTADEAEQFLVEREPELLGGFRAMRDRKRADIHEGREGGCWN